MVRDGEKEVDLFPSNYLGIKTGNLTDNNAEQTPAGLYKICSFAHILKQTALVSLFPDGTIPTALSIDNFLYLSTNSVNFADAKQ